MGKYGNNTISSFDEKISIKFNVIDGTEKYVITALHPDSITLDSTEIKDHVFSEDNAILTNIYTQTQLADVFHVDSTSKKYKYKSGSIETDALATDSNGAISFGDKNLITTGTLGCGVLTAATGSTVGNLTLADGSITDLGGAISFGNDTLSTNGSMSCGVLTAATGSTVGNLTLADGSITDSGGTITFVDENLITTGTLGCGVLTAATGSTVGNLTLADGSITDSGGAISFGNDTLSTTGDIKLGGTTSNPNLTLRNEGRIEAYQLYLTDLISTSNPGMNIHIKSEGRMIIAHDTNDDPTQFSVEATAIRLWAVNSSGGDLSYITIASGSITDSSGAISFVDDDLSTNGTMRCGVLTAATGSSVGNLTFADGSITDSNGAISFSNNSLTTSGDVTANTITSTSDRRLKQNIEYTNTNDSLQQVLAMKPVTYQFKTMPSVQRQGVIAQDLQEIAPHLVTTVHKDTDNEHLAVNYMDIVPSLIGAIQALRAEITDLKQQIV